MASDQDQLITIKTRALQQIADLRLAPKPSYHIDGQDIAWESYVASLQTTVDWCDEKLAGYEPFEFTTQGSTS